MKHGTFLALMAMLLVSSPLLAQGKIPPDRDGLLNGEGMGFASVAERNGFPGPKHVLELQEQLRLTPEQTKSAKVLAESVAKEAKALGKEIVRKEEELNMLFITNSISSETLEPKLREIGKLRADVRRIHLLAHLRMKEILTPEQIQQYSKSRGYEIKN